MSRPSTTIRADAWFDGDTVHRDPLWIRVDRGSIADLRRGAAAERAAAHRVPFLMPGLVEAHAHLFLDGGELDQAARKAHLASDLDTFMATGFDNLRRSRECGITLVRDAGDRHGVNHRLRAQWRRHGLRVRSPGLALRKRGRYGSFMAEEIDTVDDVAPLVARRAAAGADDCKVLMTGIIDFAKAAVKGAPQFADEEVAAIARAARAHGLPTFAHCSGRPGIEQALAAGIDSIEHGFFLYADALARMAERGTAWVPTWSPVAFVRDHGAMIDLGASERDGVARILDLHLENIAIADRRGVVLVAGSDAGSYGVVHGAALIDELRCFEQAGLSLAAILRSATSTPRRAWGVAGGMIAIGAPADLAAFSAVPTAGLRELDRAEQVWCRGEFVAGVALAA